LATDDVQVEVVDGLMAVFAIVGHDAVALNIELACYFRCRDHEVSEKGGILGCILHVNQGVLVEDFGEHDQMDLGARSVGGEHNDLLVFEDGLHFVYALDNSVEG